ncbi:2Fe-2S iron-sulfur cluster-binding protein [Rhodococcus sp. IEGM 1307]|jgi:2Fe-2S ferredoxin|uniref:2Fe-2S iron-sulfur cluster-binding protein n=1 Tax=Rhodococcus sp. IEGM 1307 TaxID=3047091 RepID=UPI0024B78DF1|nr:2Fe-2S iron-sulfur cluster-binding protein [Rhodococcus sp. IEGM 1307]MDI9979610.1 2Fe-2S iron-sulfur cluster-binding protein [Rhodococcus sp. IEGM 1307]
MPKLHVITREGETEIVHGQSGMSTMEVIREAGIDELMALCGGELCCATCHVYVDPAFVDQLPPISDDEDELLDSADHRETTSRLSCQLPFGDDLNDLRVTIAPED